MVSNIIKELDTFEELCNKLSESLVVLRRLIKEPTEPATTNELPDALNERDELFVYLKGRYMNSAKILPGTRFPSFMRDENWVADVYDDEIWGDVDSYIPKRKL
jgi:hypothetical protein